MRRVEQISRRLKLRQLEVLMAVAQAGTMAKAARALAISQPVVSKTIADLEDTLGVRLFDRNRRGVVLTPYGDALLRRSVAVFNDLRAGVTELESLADPTAGELRIGSSDAVAAGMLGAIIDRLSGRHPRLGFEVSLGGGLADLQYRELQTGALDLVIGRLPDAIPDDIETTVLYDDPSHVVTGVENAWARRRKIGLAELVEEPWCLPALDSYPWSGVAQAFGAQGLDLPRRVVTTRSVPLLVGLAETGRFLTILPRTVLHFHSRSRPLKILPVDTVIPPYAVGVALVRGRTVSPATGLFIAAAREIARPFAERR
jgi:DNA-binding transcriptional LysR family regulator